MFQELVTVPYILSHAITIDLLVFGILSTFEDLCVPTSRSAWAKGVIATPESGTFNISPVGMIGGSQEATLHRTMAY